MSSVSEDVDDEARPSSDEMDERRQLRMAYLYLCHLEETRLWLSSCLEEELPSATRLEESLRNGVYLARLSHFFAPDEVPLRKIYDADQSVHRDRGLCFRHTDNINYWLNAMRSIGFPGHFFPDPFDLYEKKNLPKVIYCLHALSLYLFKLGKAPRIKELIGKLHFPDNEVEQVRRTLLTNSSVSMPAFNLIDGILAKETRADSSAVIAINTAIDRSESALLLGALSTPSAQLRGVRPENIDRYLEVLERAKAAKLEHRTMRRLSTGGDEEAVDDMYERLLSLAEVQGYILETNVNVLLGQIGDTVVHRDQVLFGQLLLSSSDLSLHDIVPENVPAYYQVLLKIKDDAQQSDKHFTLARSDLQMAVQLANEKVREETQLEACMDAINVSLGYGRAEDTLEALRDPSAQLPAVYPLAAALYHDQLAFVRREVGHSLSHNHLVAGVRILNAIAEVNFALKASGTFDVVACLENPHAHIGDVRPWNHSRYVSRLHSALADKSSADSTGAFLTHTEIQDVVNKVNAEEDGQPDREDAIDRINQAIASGSPQATIEALLDPSAFIAHVSRGHVLLYQDFLSLKQHSLYGEMQLSAEDVQNVVDRANQVAVEASDMCISLATVNVGVCKQEEEDVRAGLESLKVGQLFCSEDVAVTKAYMCELRKVFLEIRRRASVDDDASIEWFSYAVRPELFFNLNLVQFVSEWSTTPKADPDSFLSLDDMKAAVLRVNERLERSLLMTELTPLLTRLQARARGFLLRRAVRDQYAFYMEHLEEIVRIQSWFRAVRQRRHYRRMLYELEALVPFVVRLQSYARGYLARKMFKDRREYYSGHAETVTFVQSQYRAKAALQDYRLLNDGTPSVPVLHKFLHMLDISEHDLSEEMELQRVKGEVVATIRRNQELEKEALDMDVRIGLLVRNCITLEDVVKGHGGGKKREKTALAAVKSDWLHSTGGGLTALSRRSRERLEAYQHLFYLLQVNPHYLAKLIFVMPVHATNSFVESVIYSVYNYGSTPRDEYLLLRLFQFALQEEVTSKLSEPSDILRGNPLVIRMVIDFFRTRGGHNCLEQLLSPLVRDVLEDGELNINLNPVDIYKKWVNHLETTSGKPGGLSYDVDEERALQHLEVCKTLHASVLSLETKARMFARRISASKDMIPYGMRYICKVLKKALEDKFSESSPDDISKVIGNILYYRYINPGVVAPDTFGVVQMTPEHPVTNLQRHNLGTIAKILSWATAAVPFNQPQHPYQMRLDGLIDSCGEMLYRFFTDACAVPEPEDWFGVDSYSEATHITPPTITLTATELRLTHKYLLEYKGEIAADPKDPLHGLLADLGPEPSLEDLVGESGGAADGSADVAVLSSVKISLSLYGKFPSEQEDDAPNTDQLLRDTKHMVVELLRLFRHVTTIQEALTAEVTPDLDRHFLELQASVRNPKNSTASLLGRQKYGSLAAFRKALQKNLCTLEDCGLASAKDDYQAVMNGIAGDILQQRNHRANRKRELAQLVETQRKLNAKTRHYEETLDYYQRYVQACLASLASTGKSRRQLLQAGQPPQQPGGDVAHHRPLKSRSVLKYTGARLHEKGILLEVSGLETSQLKNVSFEIAPTERAGVFSVRAKLLGVSADEVAIDIQDLLQRQYDGVAITELSEGARVNNNLLLYFLNKKFYGK